MFDQRTLPPQICAAIAIGAPLALIAALAFRQPISPAAGFAALIAIVNWAVYWAAKR